MTWGAIHSFAPSVNKCSLSTRGVVGTVLGAGTVVMNMTDKVPVLVELPV